MLVHEWPCRGGNHAATSRTVINLKGWGLRATPGAPDGDAAVVLKSACLAFMGISRIGSIVKLAQGHTELLV